MATFSVGFLGCKVARRRSRDASVCSLTGILSAPECYSVEQKVSHVDAHAVRERLLSDGHSERAGGADVAVVSTCCVTHEAVSKSRKAVSRLARTHGRVYVTGCAANLPENAFAGLADNVVVVRKPSEDTPAAVAGDVGAIACVQAEARLDRVRAFVKVQDGCSFSCAFCVIPQVRGASRSRPADGVLREIARRVDRAIARSSSPASTSAATGIARAGYDLPRLVREAGSTPGLARLRLSSIEVNHVSEGLVASAARDAHGGPASPHPAAVGRRPDPRGHGEALRRGDVPAPSRASRTASISRPTSSSAFPARTSRPSATR